MKENSSEKCFVSEPVHPSISGNAKNNWQTPKLIEIDYMATNEGPGVGDDGVMYS